MYNIEEYYAKVLRREFVSLINRKIYVALDIGSYYVKLVVSEHMNTKHNILCAYSAPVKGMKNGIVTNQVLVTESIQKVVQKAQNFLGFPITSTIVSIPAVYNRLTTIDNREVYSEEQVVTGYDIEQLVNKTVKMVKLPNEEVVNFIPFSFSVDGGFRTTDPREQRGKNLSVTGMVVTSARDHLFDLLRTIESAGLEVVNIFPSFYSQMTASFVESDLRQGALSINLGHDTTTIVSIRGGEVRKLKTIKMGVALLLNDLVQVFHVSLEDANKMMQFYASSVLAETSSIKTCEVVDTEMHEPVKLSEREITEVITDRLREMLTLIKNEFDYFEVSEKTKISISGGLTNLIDFDVLATEVFEQKIEVFIPEYIGARDAVFTIAAGLIELQTHFEKLFEIDSSFAIDSTVRVKQTGGATKLENNYRANDEIESDSVEMQVDVKRQPSFFKRFVGFFQDKDEELIDE